MIEANSNDHNQSEDDDVELRSKNTKITKIFGPDFLIYLLENEPQTHYKKISCLEAFYYKKTINSEIKFIVNNYT